MSLTSSRRDSVKRTTRRLRIACAPITLSSQSNAWQQSENELARTCAKFEAFRTTQKESPPTAEPTLRQPVWAIGIVLIDFGQQLPPPDDTHKRRSGMEPTLLP